MKNKNVKKGKAQYLIAAIILLAAIAVSVVILSNPKRTTSKNASETASETSVEETEISMIETEYFDEDPEIDTEPSECTVKFFGFDNQLLKTESVPYGKPVRVLELQTDGYIFKGWDKKLFVITHDMEVHALGERIADDLNIVYSNAVYAETDKAIRVPINIGGTVNCCAFKIQIEYDADLLNFKNAKHTLRGLKAENDQENGVITLTYTSSGNLQKPTSIAELQFECTQKGEYSTNLPIVTKEISVMKDGKKEYTDSVAYDGSLYLFEY